MREPASPHLAQPPNRPASATPPAPSTAAAPATPQSRAMANEGSSLSSLPATTKWAVFVALLGLAVVVVDGSLLNLALPTIASDLQVAAATTIWVSNAYQLATLVCLLPCAALGDRIGYGRVYLAGMALFVLGALMAAWSPNLSTLVAARTLQGAGGGAIISVSTAVIRIMLPPHLVGRGIALNSMVISSSSVAGPSIAAFMLAITSWHWLFLLTLPFAALVLGLGLKLLPSTRRPADTPFYWRDVAFNGLMCVLFFIGADWLGSKPAAALDLRPWGAALLVGALVVGVLFLRRQAQQSAPLFPVDLMGMPTFALAVWASVAASGGLALASVSVPFLLMVSMGLKPLEAGLLMSVWPAAIFATAPVVGRLIGRVPTGLLGTWGMLAMGAGMAAVALLPEQPAHWDIAWRLALAGVGFGMFQAPNNHAIITSPPANRAGVASGMVGMARLGGTTLGGVLVAQIFSHFPPTVATGPKLAIALGVVVALVGAACSFARLRLGR